MLLAMPAIWLAWAMTSFCVAILSYIWRTGSSDDPSDGIYSQLSPNQALAVRAVLTIIFGLGVVYFILILRTFGTYGEREAGWRRSWLATGRPVGGERTRDTRRDEIERERGRRHQRDRDSERGDQHSPSVGLGLLGASRSGSANGLASMTGVMQDPSWDQNEKKISNDVYIVETGRGKGRISPKL